MWAKGRYVREFAVSPNGRRVGMVTAPDDTVIRSEGESTVDVWEVSSDKTASPADVAWRKREGHSPHAWLENLAWNPAGDRLAFCAVYDAYPAEVHVIDCGESGNTVRRLPRAEGTQIKGYGSALTWNRGAVNCIVERAGVTYLASSTGDIVFNPDEHTVFIQAVHAADRNMNSVALVGGSERFPELVVEQKQGTKSLTAINPHTARWKLPTVTHVAWPAPDGTIVGGVLELPPGYDPKSGKRLPLVVAIHGGPTTSTKAELTFDPHNGRMYFAAKGYAVLFPNYRGSTGYGDKFLTDLVGRENDVEVNDIVAGVRHLVKEGLADPDRVGVMGWSNGGYLTNCLITRTDLPFKLRAASSGAGIVDTVAEWGFNDEPAYPMVFKKGLPWESAEVYRKTSPTYALGNVTTPTLIHVGGNDVRCPPGHSRMLYRAIKEYGKAPAELVVYPGEPHGLTKMSNRRAKMEWDLAWFDKYLMGKP